MTSTLADPRTPDWRWQHAHAATSLDDVARLFGDRFDLSGLDRPGIERSIAAYGMRATPYYLDLAEVADARDPIWRLAVPSPAETTRAPGERDDPIGDERDGLRPERALTHRYRDRVLIHATPTCAVHCRHCFRKRLVGRAEHAVSERELSNAVGYVCAHEEVHEVVLTGGDPLSLSDERLAALLGRLDAIGHVWSLRLHTRMPVVNPFRVTDALAQALAALATPVLVVAHFNHPREVSEAARAAARRLTSRGVAVLNQAVLLAGVNDEAAVHRALLWALVRAGIRPYALHHADLVPGTSHLRTTIQQGQALMRALRGTVPGHAIPHYLLDLPDGHGKVPLDFPWAQPGRLGSLLVHAPDGTIQEYEGPAGV